MRVCDYNFMKMTSDRKNFLIFNSYIHAFYSIPYVDNTKIFIDRLLKNENIGIPHKLKELFNTDEIDWNLYYKGIEEKQKSKDSLNLTILPTYNCNCDCLYCWERNDGRMLMPDDSTRILDFLYTQLPFTTLFCNWFGGEPLLNLPFIEKFSKGILEFCQKYNITYNSGMATNGTLLTDSSYELLVKCGISSFVVTLDGYELNHNKNRPLKNGQNCFELIIENIKRIIENYDSPITININANEYSEEFELDKLLCTLDAYKKNIFFHVRNIFPEITCWESYVKSDELIKAQKYKLLLEKNLVKKGFHVILPMFTPRSAYCNADYTNAYIIDPSFNIYKCNLDVENKAPLGFISEKGTLNFMSKSCFSECKKSISEKCKLCKIFPICLGGCFMASKISGVNKCPIPDEEMVLDYMELVYEQKKH